MAGAIASTLRVVRIVSCRRCQAPSLNMSLRRLLVVAQKEVRHIARDRRLFFLVTVAPSFLLITLSYVFAMDVQQIDLAVRDLDRTSLSRDLVAHITADGDFVVTAWFQDEWDTHALFVAGVADMVLVIPRGFSSTALSGRRAQVQCIVDGVDALGASQAVGLLHGRVRAFQTRRYGLRTQSADPAVTLAIQDRAWYNESLQSLISMVPGLMAVVLCMPALGFALALAREKELGSFESLIVTPVRGAEYLLGKLLAYEVGGVISAVLALLVATLWFDVPFRASIVDFLVLTAAYVAASTGVSLVVASLVRNQQTAMFVVLMIFFVPSFFLAGLIRPVAEEPLARAVAHVLPPTHYIHISRGLFLKGLGLSSLWGPALSLLAIALVCQIASLLLFDKKLTR